MSEEISGTVSNEQLSATDGGETKVNPGAIRKSTTQSILKAAQAASGMEFESVEAMMAALARLSATNNSVAPQQPVVDTAPQKRTSMNDLQEQFVALRGELSQKEQALRERELEGDIRGAMGDRFDTDLIDYAISKVKGAITWENGAYSIVNSKGQIRYGEDGNPLTIKGLVDEVARNNPKLLRQSQTTSGSGLRMSGPQFGGDMETMPDYATNPDAFNAWAAKNGLGRGQGLKAVRATVTNSMTSKRIV